MSDRCVYRGIREISTAAGLNWKNFSYFVREKGLPVWQIDGRGTYLATPEDLKQWINEQREKNLKK